MVNDVVRGPSVNLLDKLANINYLSLYTHTRTHTYTLVIFFFFSFFWGMGKGKESPLTPKNDLVLNSKL